LDVRSFLEKVFLPNKDKEKLIDIEEDRLVGEAVRKLGKALATSCLAISKLKGWNGSAENKSLEVTELLQQGGDLQQRTKKLQEELQQSQQEAKVPLTEKSKEALDLSDKNSTLLAEVDKLKEELAQKDEEMVKERKALTNDAANSYLAGFEDVVTQALGIYPGMDFSQLGSGKTVVDGQLVEE